MNIATIFKILLAVIANAPELYKIIKDIIGAAKEVDVPTKLLVKALSDSPDEAITAISAYEKSAAEYREQFLNQP